MEGEVRAPAVLSSTNNNKTPNKSDSDDDFNQETWMSLLGLVDFVEMFVTVDQTTLWQRHIAWANNGRDIREYNTKRFASNMVFLSLLLGSTMGVLMNSANFSTQMRDALRLEDYRTTKYWMGVALLLGAVVTVLGLLTTFAAWGLISAISDNNSHAILRSSMGQYVTSLPSKFVVGSLYLYLISLTLFIVDMVAGPARLVFVAIVIGLFFQVVVSLSAFGRLVIHTGAMGKKRVLQPEFERKLLPSGLHASLLIKAMEQRRRRTSAHSQYQSQTKPRQSNDSTCSRNKMQRDISWRTDDSILSQKSAESSTTLLSRPSNGGEAYLTSSGISTSARQHSGGERPPMPQTNYGSTQNTTTPPIPNPRALHERITTDENETILQTVRALTNQSSLSNGSTPKGSPQSRDERERSASIGSSASLVIDDESVDDLTMEIQFPRPSVLNRTGNQGGRDLRKVVQMTLDQTNNQPNRDLETVLSTPQNTNEDPDSEHKEESDVDYIPLSSSTCARRKDHSVTFSPPEPKQDDTMTSMAKRRSLVFYRGANSNSLRKSQIQEEWQAEHDARSMYDVEPPVDFLDDLRNLQAEENGSEGESDSHSSPKLPRASILNRLRFGSMVNFMNKHHSGDLEVEDMNASEMDQLLSRIEEEREE